MTRTMVKFLRQIIQQKSYKIRNSYQPELPHTTPKTLMDVQDNIAQLLQLILEDATGSLDGKVRVWPIRASYYRTSRRALNQLRQILKDYR